MIYKTVLSVQKTKGLLNGAGNLIYLACANDAHCTLHQIERNGKVNLNRFELDPSRINLEIKFIESIAKDHLNERI